MLTKISQQEISPVKEKNLAKRWKLILNKNKIQNHIKWYWTLILKILSKLKISTIIIKYIGGQSAKLYNKTYFMILTFSQRIFENCKNNANVPFNIPTDVKNNLNRMAMEQGLYSQVVRLHQMGLFITAEMKIKMRIN